MAVGVGVGVLVAVASLGVWEGVVISTEGVSGDSMIVVGAQAVRPARRMIQVGRKRRVRLIKKIKDLVKLFPRLQKDSQFH